MFLKKLLPQIASLVAIASIFCFVRPLHAIPGPGLFAINIAPDGAGNVVANGSGDVNLGSATAVSFSIGAEMSSFSDLIVNGPATTTSVFEYTFSTALTGPASFGTVFPITPASSGSGSLFMFSNPGFGSFVLAVPTSYTTDTAIIDSSTYTGKTLANLGLSPGTFTWTMGTGLTENTVTINVSSTPAPEPASFVLAGLCGGAMLFIRRLTSRKR
ncbi:MAG TPA: hypothetical protein VFE46_10685 [Pirellulales bacterium]|jgi:hypothetical protein|nr:hypothetical protein [Pirellulales bacterium]